MGTLSTKPRTEKPFEPVMRFFTPELYIRYNSSNDEEADRADEAWEAAMKEYHHHLNRLRDRMPSQVRELSDLCLHDAELLACDQPVEPFFPLPSEPFPFWAGFAILSVKQGDSIVSLFYVLWDRIRTDQPEEPWPFSTRRPHWLYDEVDVAPGPRGLFLHRILFSDGIAREIPFVTALIHSLTLPATGGSDTTRQIGLPVAGGQETSLTATVPIPLDYRTRSETA